MKKESDKSLEEKIILGLKLGAIAALNEHKKAGRPVVISKNGGAVEVSPDSIKIEIPKDLDADRKK